jgi:multiple sugar transport system permease protein
MKSGKLFDVRRFLVGKLPYLCLIVMLGIAMLPLISMLGSSLRSKDTFMTTKTVWPQVWSFDFYKVVLSDKRIVNYFKNSFIVGGIVTFIVASCSVIGGYALARFAGRVKGIKFYSIFLLMLQMFPLIQLIIPLYLTFQSMGVDNKMYSLIIAYPAFTLPMNLWMMKSFIEGVPQEMEEAGRIDGGSRMQILFRLVLPVSKPGIASTAILAFNQCWNEFLMAMILIRDDALRTIPIGLQNYMQENVADWGAIMAASTLMIIPVLIFLNVLQKNIVSGLTLGAVKG